MGIINKIKSWVSKNPTLPTKSDNTMSGSPYVVTYEQFMTTYNSDAVQKSPEMLENFSEVKRRLEIYDMAGLTPVVICYYGTDNLQVTSKERLMGWYH